MVVFWGGIVVGVLEVLFFFCFDVVGFEVVYGDVDLCINFLVFSVLVWIIKNVFRKDFFFLNYECV